MTDQQNLERILEEELRVVYEFLIWHWRQKGVSKADAEDAAQEGALKAFRKAGQWKGKSKRTTFLITVGIRAGLDHFKKEKRQANIRKRYESESR